MVFINEWLPNPNGADAKGEFIELFNNGTVSANLSGWSMKTTGKKIFSLGGRTITAKGYLVLTHAETKLSLKNTGESVFLSDAVGRLVDQSSYVGAAPSGQSFSRVYYPVGNAAVGGGGDALPQAFAWSVPTPGAANKVNLHNGISVNQYPMGVPLGRTALGGAGFLEILLGASAILAALVVYCLKSHENLAKLFFTGDG